MNATITLGNGAGFLVVPRPTRATLGRLIRRAIAIGDLVATDSPVAKLAWCRGFLRGRSYRLAGRLATSCHYCRRPNAGGHHNGRGGHLFISRATMIGGVA